MALQKGLRLQQLGWEVNEWTLNAFCGLWNALRGVATDNVPTSMPSTSCSIKVVYIPALMRGIAQQQ
jgi:hypothetical protein